MAILADAVSFLASALFIQSIRVEEPVPAARDPSKSIWHEIGDGLKLVVSNPMLRALASCTGSLNFFSSMSDAVLVLYVTRELGIGAGLLGLIFAAGSVG